MLPSHICFCGACIACVHMLALISTDLAMPGSIIMKYGTPTAVLPVVLTGE